jgi:ferredoxin
MKVKRRIVEINEDLCNGCGLCAQACSEGAIQIIDGKAKLVAEKYCDGLGMCLSECPQGAIQIIERDADDFDPEAVEVYLKTQMSSQDKGETIMACGCPADLVQGYTVPSSQGNIHQSDQSETVSSLTHWPVQIRLIPASAPFLNNAHLLAAADCTAVATPVFHKDFLKGKVVMIGCPKFDDKEAYIEKFADIFKRNTIRDITALVMEVPCCQGLPLIIKKGMELSGKNIPMEGIIINSRGKIMKREKYAL